jgi:uncharacterized delta-60 repeat protein
MILLHRQQLIMAATLWLSLLLGGHLPAQSALDGFDPNANNYVEAMAIQPDGKILAGGWFTQIGGQARNFIARLDPATGLADSFNPNADNYVRTIVVQTDGKILVGGYFHNIGGEQRNLIVRLDPVTGLPDSFNPNPTTIQQHTPTVLAITIQPNGKILVGGHFTQIGGQARNNIARLDPTTGLADSFDPSTNVGVGISYVSSIAIQPDGKILVGGDFRQIGGQPRAGMARLDPITGQADSFDPEPTPTYNSPPVASIALEPDGEIVAGGGFAGIGGQQRARIARLDPTTALADSFDAHLVYDLKGNIGDINAIAIQPDGKIIAAGSFTGLGGQSRNHIARLDPATALADSFNANLPRQSSFVQSVALQADGKILIGGGFATINGQTRNRIARLEIDGELDQTLNLNMAGIDVLATAFQPDGKIIIAGNFTAILGANRHYIARLNRDGTLDPAFDPNAGAPVHAIAVQADGKVLLGGQFLSLGGQPRSRIGRVDAITGQPDSFNPASNAVVRAIAVQADDEILVGGDFTSIGGQTRHNIARLNPGTGLADSFDPNANGSVRSIVVQKNGDVLVGGAFSGAKSIGGESRNFLARLNVSGLADAFDPDANDIVHSIVLQEDGRILAGGAFTAIGGAARNHLARLDSITGVADSFEPNANDNIYSVAVQTDGKVVTVGTFQGAGSIGGQPRNRIARLDGTTGLADSYDPNANNDVHTTAIQSDGKILVGGLFSGPNSIGLETRNSFARLGNDTPARQNLAVTPHTITWSRTGSSPQLARVTFEYSTDNVTYALLGEATASGDGWTMTGLSLPVEQNFYIRARGYYLVGGQHGVESIRNSFIIGPNTVGNISTRVLVQPGDHAMIGGFIITGTQPKTIAVRGIGPSLPVADALADPIIDVYDSSGQLLASNDNWRDADSAPQIIASGLAPANDFESALWKILTPGAYTVIVRGNNDSSGVGLFEVYDLDRTVDSRLANVSTRGFVQTGDNVVIGGLVVLGQTPFRVIVRAIGPSLAVPDPLADPTIALHNNEGTLIAANDNWRSDQEAEIIATGIPPTNDVESALVMTLPPGNYTAILRGANDTTGIAVVEAYGLN